MAKAKLTFYSLLLAALAAVFIFRVEIYDYFKPILETRLRELERTATEAVIEELKKGFEFEPQIEAPPPLRVERPVSEDGTAGGLSVIGIVNWTNVRRVENGLPPLAGNALLDSAARVRLKDMFAKQYFAHYSPTGEGTEDAAKEVGYEYISLGENLALGGFKSDEEIVTAWMESLGHRANILGEKYTEIGVAVERGLFADSQEGSEPRQGREGGMSWIGVQIFGKPLSLCPMPSVFLKAEAESLSSELEAMQKELEARRAEMEGMNPHTPAYRKKVEEYNALVAQYNEKASLLKSVAAEYNLQVTQFNQCIQ